MDLSQRWEQMIEDIGEFVGAKFYTLVTFITIVSLAFSWVWWSLWWKLNEKNWIWIAEWITVAVSAIVGLFIIGVIIAIIGLGIYGLLILLDNIWAEWYGD